MKNIKVFVALMMAIATLFMFSDALADGSTYTGLYLDDEQMETIRETVIETYEKIKESAGDIAWYVDVTITSENISNGIEIKMNVTSFGVYYGHSTICVYRNGYVVVYACDIDNGSYEEEFYFFDYESLLEHMIMS